MLAACRGEPEPEGVSGQPVTLDPVLAMDLVDRIEATLFARRSRTRRYSRPSPG
jgi:hypothetical protein